MRYPWNLVAALGGTIGLLLAVAYGASLFTQEADIQAQAETPAATWTAAPAALSLCLRELADRVGAVEVRAPQDAHNGNEFHFTWGDGRLKDARGAPASALCLGTIQPLKIQWLTFNGQDLI